MSKRNAVKLYGFILLLILFVPIWMNFIADAIKTISADFEYRADMISVDNFYDEETNEFKGEQISNTEFSYEVIDERDGNLLLDNKFEVYTLNGEKIISIGRILGVDSKTGLYVDSLGDKSRTGSMFAPIGIKGGESFIYWHVNYDEPFAMRYVSEESIEGLKVFKYETLNLNHVVDQTSALDHLPGVPEERGVRVYPTLRVWIEPITGMMVKYEDSANAFYYDQETGVDLNPWNSFSNQYTEASITEMVDMIEVMKWKFLFVDYMVPFVIVAFALALILLDIKYILYEKLNEPNVDSLKNKFLLVGFVFVTAGILYGMYTQYLSVKFVEQDSYKVGIIVMRETSTISQNIEAFENRLAENGYVDGENIEILKDDALGDQRRFVDIVREYINDDVDLIYTMTTGAVQLVKAETSDIPIVFSIVTYPVRQGIVDSFEDSGNNAVGVKHILPISSQWFEFNKILTMNPVLKVDRMVYVSGSGFDTTQLQYADFVAFFEEEGIEVERLSASSQEDLKSQLESLTGDSVLYAGCDTFNQGEASDVLIDYALENGKILMSCISSLVPRGALFSRSTDFAEIGEIAGDKASLILQGANPRWLRTEEPRVPLVSINAESAEKYGLEIPYDEYPSLVIYPN